MRTRARHWAAAQPLLNGHSDVRETAEEVMQTIENDGLLAKDGT
jgi:hypothetical protein